MRTSKASVRGICFRISVLCGILDSSLHIEAIVSIETDCSSSDKSALRINSMRLVIFNRKIDAFTSLKFTLNKFPHELQRFQSEKYVSKMFYVIIMKNRRNCRRDVTKSCRTNNHHHNCKSKLEICLGHNITETNRGQSCHLKVRKIQTKRFKNTISK